MKRIIISVLCYVLIALIIVNINEISSFLSSTISSHHAVTIEKPNEYTKNYDFMFVQNSKDYIPYSKSDLLNIIYSVLNQGWKEFTFYCPSEYKDCIKDFLDVTSDEELISHVNNFVHPFNSFREISSSITESGEITINVYHLYEENEIIAINNYVDRVLKEQYKASDDDYANLKRIHDYIINHTKYDVEMNNTGKSKYKSNIAYGVVVDGYGICNGYADLMAVFLNKLGYENFEIATNGEDISYDSNGHIWNAVKLDNKWLHLDLTWDDPYSTSGKNYLYHKYFLVTTEEMKKADSGQVNVEEHNFQTSIYQEFKTNPNKQ